MAANTLVLRDIHIAAAPPWWPPAPGWWLLAAALLVVAAVVLVAALRRRRRRLAMAQLFDRSVDAADAPAAQVAAMSELLRRAARRRDAAADRLQGEAWLAFLDAEPSRKRKHGDALLFSQGDGRLLLDGGYRRDIDPAAVASLRALARTRFLQWMGAA